MKFLPLICVGFAAFLFLAPGRLHGAAIEVRDGGKAVDVTGLTADAVNALKHVDWKADEWAALFALYVEPADGSDPMKRPPLLGDYRIADEAVRFTPRFALSPGVHYRAVFRPGHIPGAKKGPDVVKSLFLPRAAAETAAVQHVYPTRRRSAGEPAQVLRPFHLADEPRRSVPTNPPARRGRQGDRPGVPGTGRGIVDSRRHALHAPV